MVNIKLEWSKPVHIMSVINNPDKYSIKGLYMFLIGESLNDLFVYYIGQSGNIGQRIAEHYRKYLSGNYWVPRSIDEFSKNVYHYYRITDGIECEQKFYRPSNSEYVKEAASKLMSMTYIMYSEFINTDNIDLQDVEAVLIASVLKYNKLPFNGWIGDGKTRIPIHNFSIRNSFDPSISDLLISIIPEIVLYRLEIL